MAESAKGVAVIPLNNSNYATWKVQCQMALIKDGLWSIVSGAETAPDDVRSDRYAKFVTRRDKALAVIVLSMEPSLLYLIGDPKDPVEVWKKLKDQFQKGSWANKLSLRRKLYGLKLKDGDSMPDHIKTMTEIFDELSVIGDAIPEEDRVVHLLASLPESFNVLVTALEANQEVPKMELVTERLLHEARKAQERSSMDDSRDGAMMIKSQQRPRGPRCYNCRRLGHIQRDCPNRSQIESSRTTMTQMNRKPDKKQTFKSKQHVNQVSTDHDAGSSDSDAIGLMVRHALSAKSDSLGTPDHWIIDSGATCHVCRNAAVFVDLKELEKPVDIVLGDGRTLTASKGGDVELWMTSGKGMNKKCVLRDVLFVPELAYNLLSVSKATKGGITMCFDDSKCCILDKRKILLAEAVKRGQLYLLNLRDLKKKPSTQEIHATNVGATDRSKEQLWHRRFGHVSISGLRVMARKNMVEGLDFDCSKTLDVCEACVEGKQHRGQFPQSTRRAKHPLDLIHSDVCGKLSEGSLSGARYFLTFIDDFSRYIWIYVLKRKSEVFDRFLEWKAMVEKSTGRKVKTIRSDNGGEYLSAEFQHHLKEEGIVHERTVPKTPQQNGVAERVNRTLVESIRSMISDAKIPKRFWAEALSTVVYLRNRCSTRAVSGMTPYQAFTGVKPKVHHLRVFGCTAYAHVPADERQNWMPSQDDVYSLDTVQR